MLLGSDTPQRHREVLRLDHLEVLSHCVSSRQVHFAVNILNTMLISASTRSRAEGELRVKVPTTMIDAIEGKYEENVKADGRWTQMKRN